MNHALFVHLHVHSSYSILSSTVRVEALIDKAKACRMPALALTDQGNLFAAITFHLKCLKAGIKPILGAQVYLVPDLKDKSSRSDREERDQLILLCRNRIGYRNLLKILSIGHLEGSHGKPRIDWGVVSRHAAGLIALSAGAKGELGRLLLKGKRQEAEEAALRLRQAFADEQGAENFFIEVQRHRLPGEDELNRELVQLAHGCHIPLVASNDIHFLDKADHRAHDALVCIGGGHTLFQEDRPRYSEYQDFASPEEMSERFADLPEAIANTLVIARRCNLLLKLGDTQLPDFAVPKGETYATWIKADAERGLARRLKEEVLPRTPRAEWEATRKQYHERLEFELSVILKMGFPGYFLIVSDFIRWAKGNGIPVGPGRGSGAGSVVAWSLDITDLDPIRYTLLFERFLNPERVSMPDFDVDFCQDRRDQVIRYVQEKYGKDRVAQIITFGTMQAKAVIRDVGRVMEMPYGRVDRIAKLVPNVLGITLAEAIDQEPRLSDLMREEPEVGELMALARALEGLHRSAGTHAAGVVIANGPLTDMVPLYMDPRSDMPVTQFHKDDVEKAGLIKFDFLGLKTLTVIDGALKLINRNRKDSGEKPLRIETIDLEDKKTYREIFKKGETTGVFQLESSGMKELLKKLKPDNFEDIVALVALYRPGPLGSGMVDDFIDRKHGRKGITYPIPKLEPILRDTYGVILYQEQVMKIAQVLASYSLGGADLLRRAMGKKKPEEMAKQREIFIKGTQGNHITDEVATYIFDLMEKFAGYGFNKSHSAAYALISFQTGWLKQYHPREFMAATMTCDMLNTDKVIRFVREVRNMGLALLPPDVNHSQVGFSVENGKIRFGLAAIKNVGEGAVEAVVAAREKDGAFTSLYDLGQRVRADGINRRVMEGLIKSGACDGLHPNRGAMLAAVGDVMAMGARRQEEESLGFRSLFDLEEETAAEPVLPDLPDLGVGEKLAAEKEALGFYITGHPLQKFEEELASYRLKNTKEIHELAARPGGNREEAVTVAGIISEKKILKTKKGDRMAFFTLEDLHGRVELIAFPEGFAANIVPLESEGPLVVSGTLERGDEVPKIHIQQVYTLDGFRKEKKPLVEVSVSPLVLDGATLALLDGVLGEYGGGGSTLHLLLNFPDYRVRIALGGPFKVAACEALMDRLGHIFGEESVKLWVPEEEMF